MITIKTNPNPNSVHLALDRDYFSDIMLEVNSAEEAKQYPITEKLWQSNLRQIFLNKNMIVIQKYPDTEIDLDYMINILQNNPDLYEIPPKQTDSLNGIEGEIEEALESYVRPYLATHGGTVKLHKFEDGCAYLSLHGSCDGCPSAEETLYYHIEGLLKFKIDKINRVELIA